MAESDDLWGTPEGRARYLRMLAEGGEHAERLANAARDAIQLYVQSPNTDHEKAALAAVGQCSLFEGSEYRLLTILPLIEAAPPEIFWPAFLEAWSFCDATWPYRSEILRAMKDAGSSLAFLQLAQRQFFDTLPPLVQVFRGCSAPRVRGIAWSMERSVAEGFARGHRFIRVPEPVVASAVIPREHIFFVTDERDEKEIVLDPRRLRQVIVEPFLGA
jgi:hypothetical protein